MPKFIDITGKRFGRWLVLSRAEDKHYKHPQFLCRCECGTEKVVRSNILRTGQSRSCGCYNKDVHRKLCLERNTTHGKSKTRTYGIWSGIIQRCTNKKIKNFNIYGGRGISICDRWLKYENFLSDMGECPPDKYAIDRIDSDGNYEPSNCRWATMKEQQNNRSNNVRIKIGNDSLTINQWSERLGVPRSTIWNRIHTLGWSAERALTEKSWNR